MITLGTGVGGGIIIDRNIYKGTKGMAGELGHVIIDYHGPLSNSVTRGTVEAYLGQRFLSRFAADLITQNPTNELYKKFSNDFDQLEPVDLTNAAKDGNELAIEILAKSGQRLGYAIINYVHMMDIRKIVVSGGVSKAGDFLFEPARDIVRKHNDGAVQRRNLSWFMKISVMTVRYWVLPGWLSTLFPNQRNTCLPS